ncbi:MAG: 3-oxoacyl-ACP reductase [Gammaproteobacteria bacterium HGW-Gammaproteobacteria-1]|nr:MAG: 3-oxoacyl-ACP reductase [Gammaproteobacteria bacterium HGW-Gammaproteobacteria-1]
MANQRWIFVTGGSRGIGAGIVRRLTRNGYNVAFSYLSSRETADALADECSRDGVWCRGIQCDMSDGERVHEMSDALCQDHGAPVGLVNNAGITRDSLIFMMGQDKWHEVLRSNLDSAYHTIHAFVPKMAENGDGSIINMSSVTAFKGNPGQSNYGATKAALIGMTKSLARELGRFNLRINAVAPGLIETEMAERMPEAERKRLLAHVPLKRMGSVDEVAAMIEFLLGEGGRYLTGQTFVIDGGLTA